MQTLNTSTKDNGKPDIRSVYDVGTYERNEFGTIRTVTIDGEPRFVASDVAKALGYTNPSKAVSDHCRYVTKRYIPHPQSKDKTLEVSVIPESDLYRLIAKSQLPEAEKFESWIFDEVLPTIRKTGGYVNNEQMFIDTYLPFADDNTKILFGQILGTIRQQNEVIEIQKREITHKEDVIIGLVADIDLATKRQRIVQIVRHCPRGNYQERFRLLYEEFERKYHCNLKRRMESSDLKPKAKNTMDYIDRGMNMIPELYEIACKLFENDVEELKAEWERIVA